MRTFTAGALAVLFVMACHQAVDPPPDDDSAVSVVARFGEITLTAGELDDHVLSLPAAERPRPGEDLDAWYEEQIRHILVERRLYEEALAADLDASTAFEAARLEAEKQIVAAVCTQRSIGAVGSLGEEELRQTYEERAASFSLSERRSAYNLFLRYEPGNTQSAVHHEIEQLRQRVLQGESFQVLATRNSDSESRHRKGSFGWVTRGSLPPAVEDVLFSLEEGVPSEPVVSADGEHLFFVDQILPAHQLSFEEALPRIREQLLAERREATVRDMVAEIPLPRESLVLDRAGFVAAVETGDPATEVLRLGDYQLTLANLRVQLRQTLSQQPAGERPAPSLDLLWQQLEHLRRRELLYLSCEVPEETIEEQIAAWRRQTLVALHRQQRLVDIAARDGERLRLFYDNNLGRFSQPPSWKVRVLETPFGDAPAARMATLEAARTSGGTLDSLRDQLGGEIEESDFQTLAELSRTHPKLPELIPAIQPPALSPPYRSDRGLEIAQVVARRDGEASPFEEIESQVAAAYVAHYTQEVYDQLSEEILATADLSISPEGLEAARTTHQGGRNQASGRNDASSRTDANPRTDASPRTDVSVEELEELLDNM